MANIIEKIVIGIVVTALTPVILGIAVLIAFGLCLPLIVTLKAVGVF